MLQHYLVLALDKLFDAALTVIVIDRLWAWRERRRWKRVRVFIEIQLEAILGDILVVWSAWLADLRNHGTTIPLSDAALQTLQKRNIPVTTVLPPEDFEVFIGLCAGEALPSSDEKSFIDTTVPKKFHQELLGYLVNLQLDSDHPGWLKLTSNLQVLVPRLAEVVERLPKDKTADDEINYRTFVEELFLLNRQIDPSLYDQETWDDEYIRLARMESIARSILGAMLLVRLLRTMY